jgi:hypothetical protein
MPRAYDIPSYQLALHFWGVRRRAHLPWWRRWRWYLPWM